MNYYLFQTFPIPNTLKAVFICSSLMPSVMLDLSNVILKNSFMSCTIITSMLDSSTEDLKDEITGWMATNLSHSGVCLIFIQVKVVVVVFSVSNMILFCRSQTQKSYTFHFLFLLF